MWVVRDAAPLEDTMPRSTAAAKTVRTDRFVSSHGSAPRGSGLWIFEGDAGTREFTGAYRQAVASLPAGSWHLQP